MKLTWNGHSCFTVQTAQGSVTVDPFQDNYVPGFGTIRPVSDAVYCSHKHGDHFGVDAVQLTGRECGVDVETVSTFHDEVEGAKRGQNLIHIFSAEGMKVVHLGDLGCELTQEQIGKLGIKTYDLAEQTADQFSGGNQQKIVMAKWLLTNPRIFILDEPTRGVDVGAKYDIYEYINDLALNGSAVLFISSEIEELMGVCDRIMVMSNGKLIGELKRDEFEPSKLLEMAIGGIE